MQVHRVEGDMVGAGVVQEFVDGGVELHDVGHHVLARHVVHHAHLGLQPQAGQRRAQVVGDAGQHHRAVLLQLGQFLRHAVEADVDLADLAGDGFLVELAGVEVAISHAVGRIAQLLERPVDQARDGCRPRQGQQAGRDQPDQPGAPAGRREARAVHQQPGAVAIDGEAHPQPRFAIDAARHDGAVAQAAREFFGQALAQRALVQQLEAVARLARQNAHAFLVGHGLDQRDAVDGIRMHQGRAAEVDQRGDLLGGVQRARLELEGAQRLQPRQDAAHQQQGQQAEGTPEKIESQRRARSHAPLVVERRRAGGVMGRDGEGTHGSGSSF